MFSIMLLMGAFAVDQGLWLAKRRNAQKDADAAARAGAMAYLTDMTDTASAHTFAEENAESNLANVIDPDTEFFVDDGTGNLCVDFEGGVMPGVPSVRAQINNPSGSLFARFLGIGIDDLGATATACVGEPEALQGIDPFYIAPGASAPDPNCFNSNGTPKLGSICAIVVSSTYGDAGQRGKLGLQDDPDASNVNPSCDPFATNNCETLCTQQSNASADELVVTGSPAICAFDDGVYTSGGTYNTQKGAIACRIFGVDDADCPNVLDGLDQRGEGYCDTEFHDASAQIPPFGGTAASGLTPPFPAADVIDSPAGVDDFTEAFSKPNGDPPDSYTDPAFLIPNLCDGEISPRIWTIIIGEEPPAVSGVLRVKKFATFFVLGCWNQEAPGSTVLTGPIDPYCLEPSDGGAPANTKNLVGIFVNAFLPTGGGTLTRCDPEDPVHPCTGAAILLVK